LTPTLIRIYYSIRNYNISDYGGGIMSRRKIKMFSIIVLIITLSLVCQIGVFAGSLGDSVGINTSFQANDYLLSQNGQYRAYWQSDGNFVVYNSSWQPLWASNTSGSGKRCRFEDCGNLVIRDYEVIQKRVLVGVNNGTTPVYQFINVYKNENNTTYKKRVVTELYINANTLDIVTQLYDWINVSVSPTPNTKTQYVGTHAVKDPNFGVVCYKDLVNIPKNEVIWYSHTESGYTAGNVLIMQNDGNLVIYDENNNPVWATGTNQ